MLATILSPTTGSATIAGHDLLEDPTEIRRSIGYLSSDTGLYGRLTSREVLRYFARLSHYPAERIRERSCSKTPSARRTESRGSRSSAKIHPLLALLAYRPPMSEVGPLETIRKPWSE